MGVLLRGEEALHGESLNSEKMPRLGVVSGRLTNAAISSPLTAAVGCSGTH